MPLHICFAFYFRINIFKRALKHVPIVVSTRKNLEKYYKLYVGKEGTALIYDPVLSHTSLVCFQWLTWMAKKKMKHKNEKRKKHFSCSFKWFNNMRVHSAKGLTKPFFFCFENEMFYCLINCSPLHKEQASLFKKTCSPFFMKSYDFSKALKWCYKSFLTSMHLFFSFELIVRAKWINNS